MKTLFARILGNAFDDLPPAVKELHSVEGIRHFNGSSTVTSSWLARVLLGFPASGYNVPLRFTVETLADGREIWTRDFETGRNFVTVLRQEGKHLVECWAGVVDIELALDAEPEGISWKIVGHRVFGLPVPRLFWPKIDAKETTENGRYHFSVEVSGMVQLGYAGWLDVTQGTSS